MKESFDTTSERNDAEVEEAESLLFGSKAPKPGLQLRKRNVLLCFAALSSAVALLIYIISRRKGSPSAFPNPFPPSKQPISHLLKCKLTDAVEYEIRSFTEEYNRDPSVVEIWDSKRDNPPFDGFTFIDNAKAYGLPPGVLINGKHNRYGTAWTHQYHCLELIHEAYEATVHNSTQVHQKGNKMHDSQIEAEIHHMRHCFDYLRQHIICAMDMRLEYPTTNKDGINGYEIPRKCVKRARLDEYMGKHGQQSQ